MRIKPSNFKLKPCMKTLALAIQMFTLVRCESLQKSHVFETVFQKPILLEKFSNESQYAMHRQKI
jgi:hypothetical protein